MTHRSVGAAPSADAQINGAIFGMLLVDPSGLIREINPAAQELLGLSPQRAHGRAVLECIKISDAKVKGRLLTEEGGVTVRDVTVANVTDGRNCNITSSPLLTHDGWRLITVSAGTSVQDDDLSQGSILGPSLLAHEIKNPLAAIKGAGQLLARRQAPENRHIAQLVIDEADRIAGLVDRMQSLGGVSAEPAVPCNQHEVIREAIAAIRAGGLAAQITIAEQFDPSLPNALANQSALGQVLLNLVSNACEAATQDHARIDVATRYSSSPLVIADSAGATRKLPIEIAVIDDGPGVDASLEDQIFEPFVTTKGGGHGLGLPLVRKLMHDMGGRVTYRRAGGRTAFRLHLQVAKPSDENAPR